MSDTQNIEIMNSLKLFGMRDAYENLLSNSSLRDMSLKDQVAFLLTGEQRDRENRRLARLLRNARLKINASPEDIRFDMPRGLARREFADRQDCEWILRGQHLIITGPTGCGKTHIACALGNQACRKGLTVLYKRVPRLLEELEIAHHDGSLPKIRAQLGRTRLLILDDWALAPLTDCGRQDLLEIIDDRAGAGAVLITSQLPVDQWYDYIGEKTLADAILDRLIHGSHRISLRGESMRKKLAELALKVEEAV